MPQGHMTSTSEHGELVQQQQQQQPQQQRQQQQQQQQQRMSVSCIIRQT